MIRGTGTNDRTVISHRERTAARPRCGGTALHSPISDPPEE